MADWKMPVSYNFNPSYHAYAYGLMYPQVSEHGVPNLSWPEAAYTHSGGVTAGYFTAQTAQQSPPWSPENNGASSTYNHYPGHAQNGRLVLSYNKTEPESKAKDAEQASSDTPSDSEAHTPDSWSSASSREGVPLTNLNLPSWRERDYETDSGSPDSGEQNSTSTAGEEPVNLNLGVDALPPLPALSASPVRSQSLPRKTRAAFSEEQMNALVNRFNVQRYLTPAEMKTLAGATRLTYKQVKTWFQNRRMKLKRHQRDSSWMTERYVVNAVPNTPAPQSQFQSEPPGTNQDNYSSPQVRDPVFKRSPPKTPFYPSYPQPCSPTQATTRPPGTWSLPPAVTHYEFPNPISYMPARDGSNAVNKESSPSPLAASPTAGLWATKGITLL